MAKISKNIKRLRQDVNLTQDSLAEKLCISRQAVSSWENDRTQPDVDMLERLSEVFGVSIEEIIYGKKRNTTLETEKQTYGNTLTIVFSILGALLVGVGLVLIFVTFWQDMSLMFKGILSFVSAEDRNIRTDGKILTLNFRVKTTAENGEYVFEIKNNTKYF